MTEKKNILIATDCFMPRIDGIARFLEMLIPELEEQYNVTVIAPDFSDKFEKKGNYELHRVPLRFWSAGDFPLSKKPKNIKSLVEKADIIFTQTIGTIGANVIKEANKQEKTVISFVHSIEWILVEKSQARLNIFRPLVSLIIRYYAKYIYNKCTSIIVPSPNVGEILTVRGINRPKYIVPLGIDTDYFSPGAKAEAKEAIGFEKDDFVVGYVGRIAREKNITTLFKAFRKLEMPGKRLVIVGEGLSSIQKKLNRKNITITGKIHDIVPYLRAMDAFVMPSLTETTCFAVLEAMSCEIPVVSTKVGGIKDYLIHAKNGLFFPKKNDVVLSIRLKYLHSHPIQSKSMAKNGRKTVIKEHSWRRTKDQILNIFGYQTK